MKPLVFRWLVIKWIVAVILGLILPASVALMAQPELQQQPERQKQQQEHHKKTVDFAMQRLAIHSAIEQLDTVIDQTLHNLQNRQQQLKKPLLPQQLKHIGDSLELHFTAGRIRTATERNLLARLPDNNNQALAVLGDGLVDRVANFDVSLEMQGAVEKFTDFQQQLVLEEVAAERIELLRRLDSALQSSEIAAMLQSELADTADLLAAQFIDPVVVSAAVLKSRHQQRQRHLAEVLLALNLYSYRFMPDQELQHYVSLLERDSVQTLLAACKQALYQSLLAARAAAIKQLAGISGAKH